MDFLSWLQWPTTAKHYNLLSKVHVEIHIDIAYCS